MLCLCGFDLYSRWVPLNVPILVLPQLNSYDKRVHVCIHVVAPKSSFWEREKK